MATLTPLTTSPKIRLNDGQTSSGTTKTKTMSLFSTTLTKTSLDTAGIDAVAAVCLLLEPLLLKTINRLEISTSSQIETA